MPEKGFLSSLPEPPRKVAVLRASRIGDFLCAYPALRALRAGLPEAEISLITLPMLRELAGRLPTIDRVIDFPGFPGIASQLFEPQRTTAFLQAMQAERFDLALQMHGSGVYSNPFALLMGARRTAGFIRPGDPPDRLDGALEMPQHGHEVERLLAMVDFLGLPRQGSQTEFPLWEQDRLEADQRLAGLEPPLLGVHPFALSLTRRWSMDRFTAVTRSWLERHGGTAVLLGGAGESVPAARLEESLAGFPVLNLAGKTSLPVLGAVIARLGLLITNDSGPAHIAYALGTPTVTVWGAEDLERYGPPDLGPFEVALHPVDCRPCGYAECPIGYVCLEGVTVSQVLALGEEVYRRGKAESQQFL